MHRPGHMEDGGEAVFSMDRRKYLSTIAAGAAFGTVAVGLAACNTGTGDATRSGLAAAEATMAAGSSTDPTVTGRNLWGYLRVFPSDVTKVSDAKPDMLDGKKTYRIPYYNNNRIDLVANPIVGFNLLTIGCPAKFAIAINLTTADGDHDEIDPPHDKIVERNEKMDATLKGLGYEEFTTWKGADTTLCP